jgi:hypothetical protein
MFVGSLEQASPTQHLKMGQVCRDGMPAPQVDPDLFLGHDLAALLLSYRPFGAASPGAGTANALAVFFTAALSHLGLGTLCAQSASV